MLLETGTAVATDESFLLFGFFLFGNFVPYLLGFEGMKNSMAVLRSSQDGGDPEQIGLEGRGKMGYFSTRKWLQQKFDAQAASVFSAVVCLFALELVGRVCASL